MPNDTDEDHPNDSNDDGNNEMSEMSSIAVKSDDSNDEDFVEQDDDDDENDNDSSSNISYVEEDERRSRISNVNRKKNTTATTRRGGGRTKQPPQATQNETKKRSQTATRGSPRKQQQKRRLFDETNSYDVDSEEEEFEEEEEYDDDDAVAVSRVNNRTKRGRKTSLRQRNGRASKTTTTRRLTRRSVAATRSASMATPSRRRNQDDDDSSDDDNSNDMDDELIVTPERYTSGRKQRTSAQKANESLSRQAQLDLAPSADSDDDENENKGPPTKRQRRRINVGDDDDDDDDFVVNELENDDDDDVVIVNSDDDDDVEEEDVCRHRISSSRVNIDKEQIGTDDDDSNVGEAQPVRSEPLSSPGLREISPSQRNDFDISSSSGNDRRKKRRRMTKPSSTLSKRQSLPDCPSTQDLITAERLPKRHVCFIASDGSRQCFALSTLHRIATSASFKRYRTDIAGNQKQTFLQPPHFRSEMTDDMLDQIASRFGREALDIDGPYWNRIHDVERNQDNNINNNRDEEDNRDDDSDEGDSYDDIVRGQSHLSRLSNELADNDEFLRLVQQYVKAQMGSQDLYVCPICFSIAQVRFKEKGNTCVEVIPSDEDDEDDESENDKEEHLRRQYLSDTIEDPLAVLRSMDISYAKELQIASTFCRKRVVDIKAHIREDHFLNTNHVQGNALYARFKIREQDG